MRLCCRKKDDTVKAILFLDAAARWLYRKPWRWIIESWHDADCLGKGSVGLTENMPTNGYSIRKSY